MRKFKIDLRDHSETFPYGLYGEVIGWFRTTWIEISYFQTRDAARAHYEKIKDLPEYL